MYQNGNTISLEESNLDFDIRKASSKLLGLFKIHTVVILRSPRFKMAGKLFFFFNKPNLFSISAIDISDGQTIYRSVTNKNWFDGNGLI